MRDLGSFSAVVLALAYASGFIVVHAFLGRAGIVPFGLLSVQYLVAGVLFLSATCLVWLPIGAGKLIVRQVRPASLNLVAYAFVVLAGWALGVRLFIYVGVTVGDTIRWLSIAGIGLLILMSTTWRKIALLPTEPLLARTVLMGFVPSLLLWVVLATTFGNSVYPKIGREFGGGRPVGFELRFAPGTQVLPSGTYDVLAITDRYWIVRDTGVDTYHLVPSEQVVVATLKGETTVE